ncbi:amidase family protein [Coniochaeta ligniaria NRRL 30616]|uniref:Amidase family protein n=1 Tax=Coniochaeta ligniaria NRRL 30616 TaxID=1408157 RepID=A0A1J7IZA4_9PEZI|nr:amidase family protein [Coniochaeta ligniaria NRRL 30616]
MASAAPTKRSAWKKISSTPEGGVAFTLGEGTYFANLEYPKALLGLSCKTTSNPNDIVPFTIISVQDSTVTASLLEGTIAKYLAGDDVFSADFLEGIYIAYNGSGSASIDASAVSYLDSIAPSNLLLDAAFSASAAKAGFKSHMTIVPASNATALPAGPYAVSVEPKSIAFNVVYRLYEDEYRDFLYGTYDTNDGEGTHSPLELFFAKKWYPYIPVPSRIYSWSDSRPLAGFRVAIKDLYDMKGLITSGGSQAWATITTVANETAPSIQRIVDLGGVLVGKYKLAQFASGANPWDWQDEQYPWNPRGDGYLTCSASSSGGGCSVAAYPWLDYAIGSDTGSSMRRPAAVSGTYGNRPSQGMITLDHVLPLGAATDTAGVFSRNVHDWVHFAKNWYTPDLHQPPSVTGLTPLEIPDNTLWPKRVKYLTDYLPLANPAAEAILQTFLGQLTGIFNMTLEKVAFSSIVNGSSPSISELVSTTSVIASLTQYWEVGKPLVEAWAALYDGRYPPVDSGHRSWANVNATRYSQASYDAALATKRRGVDWFEKEVLYSTPESCSESIMVWDIGTGGLPSFREEDLVTNNSAAAFLAQVPARAALSGATICPIFGCVDMTIPIGQVPYYSNVTYHVEYMPVTVSVIAKRGCDFMLWNMFEKLADMGVLKEVKTGRTAF